MERLSRLLQQLPGVGPKTASRLMLAILSAPAEYGRALSKTVADLVDKVHPCEICGMLSERKRCTICTDPRRDSSLICVVERVPDLLAIEASHEYRGLYHVLHGVLNPLEGAGPEQLRIDTLVERLGAGVREVILATSSSVEGEATALYLKKRIAPLGITVSRLAAGIPVGGELEYTDSSTIGRALAGRKEI
ncbi:MAG: recombination protein RecR [Deltaproteobacteria bacterium]|nr:recombination protein RecR [Deltaproteobacteria bacterium]